MGDGLDALWAILQRDVAEAALAGGGDPRRRGVAGQAAYQGSQVLDELAREGALGDAGDVVEVDDLAGDVDAAVLGQRLGEGVLVPLTDTI